MIDNMLGGCLIGGANGLRGGRYDQRPGQFTGQFVDRSAIRRHETQHRRNPDEIVIDTWTPIDVDGVLTRRFEIIDEFFSSAVRACFKTRNRETITRQMVVTSWSVLRSAILQKSSYCKFTASDLDPFTFFLR